MFEVDGTICLFFFRKKVSHNAFFTIRYNNKEIRENNWIILSVFGGLMKQPLYNPSLSLHFSQKSPLWPSTVSQLAKATQLRKCCHVVYLKSSGCVLYGISPAFRLDRMTHSNPCSWIKCRITFRKPPHKHIYSCCLARYVSLVREKPPSVPDLMCRFKRELSLSPCFPRSLFLVFLLFSSANLFKLLSPFLLSPSLISKPQSLYAAGAQLCVCDCVCVRIHVCLCLCGFFWHSAATLSIAHCTQRTRAAKKRGKKRKGENRGKTFER